MSCWYSGTRHAHPRTPHRLEFGLGSPALRAGCLRLTLKGQRPEHGRTVTVASASGICPITPSRSRQGSTHWRRPVSQVTSRVGRSP